MQQYKIPQFKKVYSCTIVVQCMRTVPVHTPHHAHDPPCTTPGHNTCPQHFFASARPLPYNVCKEAGPLLLALIIRTSSCTVTQELAADIIIEASVHKWP